MNAVSFQIKLDNDRLPLESIREFLGKDVFVTITEVVRTKPKRVRRKKTWHHLGSAPFALNLEQVNIRDFAHD